MKRSNSQTLRFPVKKSGRSSNAKKSEQPKEKRGYGLGAPVLSGSMSVDGPACSEPAGQAEVTSPPARRMISAPPQLTPVAPRPTTESVPAVLSSPFAAWKVPLDFDELPTQQQECGDGEQQEQQEEDEPCQLATPFGGSGPSAAAVAVLGGRGAGNGASRAEAAWEPEAEPQPQPQQQAQHSQHGQQHQPENDENLFSWLVSPARPPRKAAPSAGTRAGAGAGAVAATPGLPALATPEKDGPLSIQSMPSLSSWMVPAARPPPPPPKPEPVQDVLACLAFDPAQPRKLDRPPSPLERLLGAMGDSDWAPTVALWDEEEEGRMGEGKA